MPTLAFALPTKIFFEEDCVKNHPEAFHLGKKALLVTGRSSARHNGSEKDVLNILNAAGIACQVFNEVDSNPDIAVIRRGAEAAKICNADFIIAIGGGSPMDAAKAIALTACQDIPDEKLFDGNYQDAALPLVMLPTTAGTGSEVTPYSILSDTYSQTKRTIASPLLFPRFALLDPRYQQQLPLPITIHTALDALSHNIESCLSKKSNVLITALAQEGIHAIGTCFPALCGQSPITQGIRSQLMYGSLLGGIAIAHTGTNIVHALGYSLTYFRHIDHGRANALLLVAFLQWISSTAPQQIKAILDAAGCPDIQTLQHIIDQLLGSKETFSENELQQWTKIAAQAKNIYTGLRTPSVDDILSLYRQSLI